MSHYPMSVLDGLGYDEFGNNSNLLHPNDLAILNGEAENGKYGNIGVPRAGHEYLCENCNYPLYSHPKVQGALYLTRTCVGIVKL
jgi:hypothetical protein